MPIQGQAQAPEAEDENIDSEFEGANAETGAAEAVATPVTAGVKF